ncbi:hypothetical protein CRE_27901 [Caenorhabditis remanei]|uniref:Uncharacterized protein n=1 Tax=Caenorhabditis remanei TaxID=31234 RepID=E3NI23_CAERE|nr:hypothetical protein CRE_27901 [Caenorhabditis remanei]
MQSQMLMPKQEPVARPLWEELPVPPHVVLPSLPIENPGAHMTMPQYLFAIQAPNVQEQKWATVVSRNSKQLLEWIILDSSTKYPMEGAKNRANIHKWYCTTAVSVYKRTGLVVHPSIIRDCLRAAKQHLYNRLMKHIKTDKLSPKEVEEKLWAWPTYPFVKAFRTEKMEKKMRSANLVDENGAPIVIDLGEDDSDDDDDEDLMPPAPATPAPATPASIKPTLPLNAIKAEYYSATPVKRRHVELVPDHSTIAVSYLPAAMPKASFAFIPADQTMDTSGPMEPDSSASVNPPPSEQDLQDFEADMMAIHRDVMRKARKDPKKMDLIRAAHAQMMAEINTTKTNDLGEMFMNVGRRNLGNVFNTD